MHTHDEWLHKAKSDLRAARVLFATNEDLVLDASVYHTQQCAEKSLKAYLAFEKHEIEKIHNLVFLTKICSQYDKSFESLLEIMAILNPYGFKFRYPDDFVIPERHDAEKAIEYAGKAYNFVRVKIEESQKGQSNIFKLK